MMNRYRVSPALVVILRIGSVTGVPLQYATPSRVLSDHLGFELGPDLQGQPPRFLSRCGKATRPIGVDGDDRFRVLVRTVRTVHHHDGAGPRARGPFQVRMG